MVSGAVFIVHYGWGPQDCEVSSSPAPSQKCPDCSQWPSSWTGCYGSFHHSAKWMLSSAEWPRGVIGASTVLHTQAQHNCCSDVDNVLHFQNSKFQTLCSRDFQKQWHSSHLILLEFGSFCRGTWHRYLDKAGCHDVKHPVGSCSPWISCKKHVFLCRTGKLQNIKYC